ncbi:peroxiredoxin [Cupriavidus sp. USMAHM13]|uniref:peroxiredoxin n=1 Tax=Cupriavidus sp. USMAHM13 TaxID=1389192 RepID=UPI0008A6BE1B|nr:peroxiredoxin [Cupriavidus sp. USMAHM13]AOY99860.1 peroxiredoxin [Cupriavidus sp. USMAHM13]
MVSHVFSVDWSTLPAPTDDGAARHLPGKPLPHVALTSTDGDVVDLSRLSGRTVLYAFPRMHRPDQPITDGWFTIPGAPGCTPQSCAFRDHAKELAAAGAAHIFGLSTQDTADQCEGAKRLHLPFPLLSDHERAFTNALSLPTFEAGGRVLLKRLTLIIRQGVIEHVFYPVFPPDQNAEDVLNWLQQQRN